MAGRRYLFKRREPSRLRGARRLVAGLVVLLAVAWVVGLATYAGDIPRVPVVVLEPTDAVVVLTGGSRRLEAGMALLKKRAAPVLFVSGVNQQVDPDRIRELIPEPPDGLDRDTIDCCVVLGFGASDTIGNARETATWARANGVDSLTLVTSNYHMPRARLEFAHALPGVAVTPFPVFPPDVRMEAWWRWPGTFGLIAGEWTKFLFARARIAFQDVLFGPVANAR